jgi:hypothetical protein
MCKIAIITGINTNNRAKAIAFAKRIASEIALTQPDGLGYTAFDEKGNMISEKWTNVKHAFKIRQKIEEKVITFQPKNEDKLSKLDQFINYGPDSFNQVPNWQQIGNGDFSKITAIMIHGRMATTGAKSLKNTHPFIHNSASLIHNGIIHNHTTFKKNVSDCDSEVLLTRYNEENVSMFPEKIESAMNPISGYYACGVMAYDQLNNPIVDIFKKSASLYATELACDLLVMSTAKADILESCKATRIKCSRVFSINDGVLLRINGISGEIVLKQKFSTGYSTSSGTHYRSHTNYNYDQWSEYDPYNERDIPSYKQEATTNKDNVIADYDLDELDDLRILLGLDETYWKEMIEEYKKDWGHSWEEMLITDCEIELRNRKAG